MPSVMYRVEEHLGIPHMPEWFWQEQSKKKYNIHRQNSRYVTGEVASDQDNPYKHDKLSPEIRSVLTNYYKKFNSELRTNLLQARRRGAATVGDFLWS